MQQRRLVQGLTVAFGVMSLLLVVVGLVANPIALAVAAVFLVVTYLLWYHASGRLARRIYRSVEQRARVEDGRFDGRRRQSDRGGFGAGPRAEWTGPRRGNGRQRRGAPNGQQRQRSQRRRARTATGQSDVTRGEAYEVLGVDPGAGQDAIHAAYRERIKDVHPDTDGGDAEAFRRVKTAYERLAD